MTFTIVLLGWIVSLSLHEFLHALVAYLGGDVSVKEKGYLTFNPLKYSHPLYSFILPLLFLLLGGIGLPGGAVYIETWRLRNSTWRSLVSLAGPMANLLIALGLAIALQWAPMDVSGQNNPWPGLAFLAMLQVSALVLNLIPLPPFDGYGILEPYLSPRLREGIETWRTWIMLLVFLALWNVPLVNLMFWTQVYTLSIRLGIPLPLAIEGFLRFRFWEM